MARLTQTQFALSRRQLLLGPDYAEQAVAKAVAQIATHCLPYRGIACRGCEDACGEDAIRFRPRPGGHYHPKVDHAACTACGDCVAVCPVAALSIVGGGDEA